MPAFPSAFYHIPLTKPLPSEQQVDSDILNILSRGLSVDTATQLVAHYIAMRDSRWEAEQRAAAIADMERAETQRISDEWGAQP